MSDVLQQQYSLIRSTRESLFTFLEGIPLRDLHTTLPNFGSGSIIKTHIHAADCYQYWLSSFVFQQKRRDATDREIEQSDVAAVRARFDLVDQLVQRFMDKFDSRWFESVEVSWQQEPWSTTPLWLLTHTETHEFHHKGQIVAMARHLGYTPPDTDLRAN